MLKSKISALITASVIILFLVGVGFGISAINKYKLERQISCGSESGVEKTYERGNFVRVLISGQKGQIIRLPALFDDCGNGKFSVRIASHGIGKDGGLWDSAKPEVLPIKELRSFEFEPWTEE